MNQVNTGWEGGIYQNLSEIIRVKWYRISGLPW